MSLNASCVGPSQGLVSTISLGQSGFAMNRKQLQWSIIYMNVLELAAIGGKDYTSLLTTDLITDTIASTARFTPDQRRTAWFNINRQNANAAGASVPSTPAALIAATACCLQAFSDPEAVQLMLACRLGQHATY